MDCFQSTCRKPIVCPDAVRPAICGVKGEYIVERVVNRHVEYTQYCGTLCVEGLSEHLCGALSLCELSVIHAERNICANTCGDQRECASVRLTLLCTVVDSRGCAEQGVAVIDVSCRKQHCLMHGANIRFGAQIRMMNVCYAGQSAFSVHLNICLQTVISCAEILCQSQHKEMECRPLPLYPQPRTACRAAKTAYCADPNGYNR